MDSIRDNYDFTGKSSSLQSGFVSFQNNKKHYFHFNDIEGHPILFSQAYKNDRDRDNGIRSVAKNIIDDEKTVIYAEGDQIYFAIKAGNNQEISRSRNFESEDDLKDALWYIKSLMQKTATVEIAESEKHNPANANYEKRIQELTAALSEKENKLGEVENSLIYVESEHSECQNRTLLLEKQLEEIQHILSEKDNRIIELIKEQYALETKNLVQSSLEKKVEDLENSLTELSSSLNQSLNEKSRLFLKNEELTKQILGLNDKINLLSKTGFEPFENLSNEDDFRTEKYAFRIDYYLPKDNQESRIKIECLDTKQKIIFMDWNEKFISEFVHKQLPKIAVPSPKPNVIFTKESIYIAPENSKTQQSNIVKTPDIVIAKEPTTLGSAETKVQHATTVKKVEQYATENFTDSYIETPHITRIFEPKLTFELPKTNATWKGDFVAEIFIKGCCNQKNRFTYCGKLWNDHTIEIPFNDDNVTGLRKVSATFSINDKGSQPVFFRREFWAYF